MIHSIAPGGHSAATMRASVVARPGGLLAGSVLCCLAMGAALALASPARAEPISPGDPRYLPGAPLYDENPVVSAEYTGTIKQEFASVSGEARDKRTANLSWKTKVSGPIDQIEYGAPEFPPTIHWTLEALSGEVKDSGQEADKKPYGCTGTFSPTKLDVGVKGMELPANGTGAPAGGGEPATNGDYAVTPPSGMPAVLISSAVSEVTGVDPICAAINWNSNSDWGGPSAPVAFGDAVFPKVFFPAGGPYTQKIELTCSSECEPGANLFKVTIASSITFTSAGTPAPISTPTTHATPPGGSSPAPEPFNWLPESKRKARLDLDRALEAARNYCAPYALGLAGAGAGVLLSGAPGINITLTVGGSLVAAASEPFCNATIKRVADDVKRYRDPPDPSFATIARPAATRAAALPGCGRWKGSPGRFCTRLRAAEGRWVAAAQLAGSVDDALSTTTNRESAALAAGDKTAIAAQSAAGVQLQSQESTALSAEGRAGRETAAVLRSGGLRFRMSRAQSLITVRRVELGLTRLGIATSTLTALGSPVLKPRAVDLLAALSR